MSTRMDVVAEYYAAFNRRDPEIYARLFTKDCELVAPGVQITGIEAMRTFDQAWSSAFSEARIESMRMMESESAVLSGNWFHGGTHTQPLQTPAGAIPATGGVSRRPTARGSNSTATGSRRSGLCSTPTTSRQRSSGDESRGVLDRIKSQVFMHPEDEHE